MQIRKQVIQALPLEQIADLPIVEAEQWCKTEQIAHFATWMLPQLLAHFGSWSLVGDSAGISIVETLKCNIRTQWDRGAWKLTRVKRSTLLARQIAQAEYGAFTPLILAGFRKMQGVSYERWRGLERVDLVVEPELLAAVELGDYGVCGLGSARLLELRAQGLVTQSGANAGRVKPAESTWALSGLQGTELDGLPKWTQTMLTQCWLAHPKHRSQYMILDPENWDRMPEPLIGSELFQKPVNNSTPKLRSELDAATLPF